MSVRILTGDAMAVLKMLPAESVHCVVTSPPYYGLRDYGTAAWSGGDEAHAHVGSKMLTAPPGSDKQASNAGALSVRSGDCACGAVRQDSQLGLEATPDEYIANMVALFREVRRVLRRDGTVWLNIGDSYAGSGKGPTGHNGIGNQSKRQGFTGDPGRFKTSTLGGGQATNLRQPGQSAAAPGCKPKDLIGIPWMLAFALRADGWYLRADIIWSKPNPMPESVTDRPTKAHEYVFLLSKSARYYYDADAIREPHASEWIGRDPVVNYKHNFDRGDKGAMPVTGDPAGRNKRSVWEIATEPFPEAHFATYPTALVEPCIKAGCPKGGTVLDPFGGAGTTGLVADRLNRNAILIELNPLYAEMARSRVFNDMPMFADVELSA